MANTAFAARTRWCRVVAINALAYVRKLWKRKRPYRDVSSMRVTKNDYSQVLVGGHCRVCDVESTDNNAQWHLGCRSDSTVRTSPLSESLSSICSHAHSILNITNAVHTRSPPPSDSRRSGWYFVARRECSLSSACLRLTSRPKTCSRVLSIGPR